MGAKGKSGEKSRNGWGWGMSPPNDVRKEGTLTYPRTECQAGPPSYPTAILDSSLLDLRNQSKLDPNLANPGKLIHNQPTHEEAGCLTGYLLSVLEQIGWDGPAASAEVTHLTGGGRELPVPYWTTQWVLD